MTSLNQLYDDAIRIKEQGDLDGAVAKLRQILEQDANFALAHSALAVTLQKLGQNRDAVQHAIKVTELEPRDPFSYTQLSVICQRCGLIREAEDAMARARQVQVGG